MFSTWMVDGPLRLHPEEACPLPLPVLELLSWRSDACASVDGTLSSDPAAHEFLTE